MLIMMFIHEKVGEHGAPSGGQVANHLNRINRQVLHGTIENRVSSRNKLLVFRPLPSKLATKLYINKQYDYSKVGLMTVQSLSFRKEKI